MLRFGATTGTEETWVVPFSFVDGSADSADYSYTGPMMLTFAPNRTGTEVSQTIVVDITDDSANPVGENAETFELVLQRTPQHGGTRAILVEDLGDSTAPRIVDTGTELRVTGTIAESDGGAPSAQPTGVALYAGDPAADPPVPSHDTGSSATDGITSNTTPTFTVSFANAVTDTTVEVTATQGPPSNRTTVSRSRTIPANASTASVDIDFSGNNCERNGTAGESCALTIEDDWTVTASNTANGKATVNLAADDAITVHIDTTAPTVTVTASAGAQVSERTFTASDGEAGTTATLNYAVVATAGDCPAATADGTYTEGGTAVARSSTADNGQVMCFWLADVAGNTGNGTAAIAGIDPDMPTIAIATDPVGVTEVRVNGSVNLEFTLNEAAGSSDAFEAGDVVVGEPDTATATLSNFAGSGTSFTATLNVGSSAGSVSVSVPAGRFEDAAGNDSEASNTLTFTVKEESGQPENVDLAAASDLGSTNMDNITSAAALSFVVDRVVAGAELTVTATQEPAMPTDPTVELARTMEVGAGNTSETVVFSASHTDCTETTTPADGGDPTIETSHSCELGAGAWSVTATHAETSKFPTDTAAALSVTIDRTAPTVTIPTQPTAGAATSKSVTAAATDNAGGSGVASFSYLYHTADACPDPDPDAVPPVTYTTHASGTALVVDDDAHEGSYVCFRTADTAGNTHKLASNQISGLDTTGPVVRITTTATFTVGSPPGEVKFEFDEAPTSFAEAHISVSDTSKLELVAGTLTQMAGSTTVWTADFNALAEAADPAALPKIELPANQVTDALGNGNPAPAPTATPATGTLSVMVAAQPASAKPTIDVYLDTDKVASTPNVFDTFDDTPTFTVGNVQVGAKVVVTAVLDPDSDPATDNNKVVSRTYENIAGSALTSGSFSVPFSGSVCDDTDADPDEDDDDPCELDPDGTWTITATQTETNKGDTGSDPLTLLVDTAAPTIVTVSPETISVAAGASEPVRITFNEAIDPDSFTADAVVPSDATKVALAAPVPVAGNAASYTIGVTGKAITPSSTPVTLSLAANKVTDLVGNHAAPVPTLATAAVTAALTPTDEPRILAPAAGEEVFGTLDVLGSSEKGASVRVTVGSLPAVTVTATSPVAGTVGYWSVSPVDISGLGAGQLVISVVATASGKAASRAATVSVTVLEATDQPIISQPVAGLVSSPLLVSGTAEEGASVTVTIGSGVSSVAQTVTADSSTGVWTTTALDVSRLASDTEQVTVSAVATAAGKAPSPARTVQVRVTREVTDQPTISQPEAGAVNTPLTVSGTAEAGASVTVTVGSGASAVTQTGRADSSTGAWNTTALDVSRLASDTEQVTVSAVATAAGKAPSPARTVQVRVRPLTATPAITNPATDGATVTRSTSFTVAGTIANDLDAAITVTIGSGQTLAARTVNAVAGSWSADLDISDLPVGNQTITAVATAAGKSQSGNATRSITIAAAALPPTDTPTITALGPADRTTNQLDTQVSKSVRVKGTAERGARVRVTWTEDADPTNIETVTALAHPGTGAWSALFNTIAYDENRNLVMFDEGAWTVSVTAQSTGKSESAAATAAVTVDNTAPTVELSINELGARLHRLGVGEAETMFVRFSEDVTGFALDAFDAPSHVRLDMLSPDPLSPKRHYSIRVTGASTGMDSIRLAPNKFQDAAGNRNTGFSNAVSVTVSEPPAQHVTEIVIPGPNAAVGASFTVAGTTVPGASVSVSIGAAPNTVTRSTTASASGNWSVTLNVTAAQHGSQTITATATGGSLTVPATDTQAVTVDAMAPTATLALDPPTVNAQQTATVEFAFSEPVAVFALSSVVVTDDVAQEDVVQLAGLAGSGQSYTATLTALRAGTATLTLPAGSFFDRYGNPNTAPAVLEVVVGAVVPLALAPASDSGVKGDGVTNVSTPTFVVSQVSAGAEVTVTARKDSVQVSRTARVPDGATSVEVPFENRNCAATAGGTENQPCSLADGSWQVTATNAAGSTIGTLAVVIDTVAPAVTVAGPANTNPARLKFVSASDDALVGSTKLYARAQPASQACPAELPGGWLAQWEFPEIFGGVWLESESFNGTRLCVWSRDIAGNAGVASSAVIGGIDRTAPSIVTVTAADSSLEVGESTRVTFVASEPVVLFGLADVTVAGGAGTLSDWRNAAAANPLDITAPGRVFTAQFTATAVGTARFSIPAPTAYVDQNGNAVMQTVTHADGTTTQEAVRVAPFTDVAGNPSAVGNPNVASIAVTDTIVPTIFLVVDKIWLAHGEEATLTFTASEPINFDSATHENFELGDINLGSGMFGTVSNLVPANPSGPSQEFTATFTATTDTSKRGIVRMNVLERMFTDAAGNPNTAPSNTVNIGVGITSPPIVLSPGQNTFVSGNSFKLSGLAEPDATVIVEVLGQSDVTTTSSSSAAWETDLTLGSAVADGPLTLNLFADAPGKDISDHVELALIKDSVAPVIQIPIQPATGPATFKTVVATASDPGDYGGGISSFEYAIAASCSSPEPSASDRLPYVAGSTLTLGPGYNGQRVCFFVADAAGNTARMASYRLADIDATHPTIAIYRRANHHAVGGRDHHGDLHAFLSRPTCSKQPTLPLTARLGS